MAPTRSWDLGETARRLGRNEFVARGDMAFRTEALRRVGGFDEALGRVRDNLQGEEDIAVQRKLSKVGHGAYAASARVRHFIPASRTNWTWLLKRYAWQGVSDVVMEGSLEFFLRQSFAVWKSNQSLTDIINVMLKEPETQDDALQRVTFVRALVAGLLHANMRAIGMDVGPCFDKKSNEPVTVAAPATGSSHFIPRDAYIFVELGKSHSYLMDAYGDLPGATLINPDLDPWRDESALMAALHDLRTHVASAARRPFFLSLNSFLLIDESIPELQRIGGAGILHRRYDGPIAARNLRCLVEFMDVTSYSPKTAAWVELTTGRPCKVIPHPPLFFKNASPGDVVRAQIDKLQSRAGRLINVAMVGEVRPGKGFELALRELRAAGAAASKVKLTLAGGASPREVAAFRDALSSAEIAYDFSLVTHSGHDHRGVSDVAFSGIIESADIMLFPYTGKEAGSMSGHFVDSIFAGCRVLVSSESAMKPVTDKWLIGATFDAGRRGALLAALLKELSRESLCEHEKAKLEAFSREYSLSNCNAGVAAIMGNGRGEV